MTTSQGRVPVSAPASIEHSSRRYYEVGGVTVEVAADLPISDRTFASKFCSFEVGGTGRDTILIHHRFELPEHVAQQLGREVYRRPPWAIYHHENCWTYLAFTPAHDGPDIYCAAHFDSEYARAEIFHASADRFRQGGNEALTLFPTDQILLSQVLANRGASILHSAGAILDGKGFLFVGHSGAGKSTILKLLEGRAEILCDDRNIVRHWPDEIRVHGTWCHGEIARVSNAAAPLRAILFLQKSSQNRLTRMQELTEVVARLLGCLARPLVNAAWWEKSLGVVSALAQKVPCFEMQFDRSGRIVRRLETLAHASRIDAEACV